MQHLATLVDLKGMAATMRVHASACRRLGIQGCLMVWEPTRHEGGVARQLVEVAPLDNQSQKP